MPFTKEQRSFLENELQQGGWVLKESELCLPSEGLKLGDNEFNSSPEEVYETMNKTGIKISSEKKRSDWQVFSKAHFQVCSAILKMKASNIQ